MTTRTAASETARSESAWRVHPDTDPFDRLDDLLPRRRPLIVDGGANKGRTVDKFLRLRPEARILAYEPIPELAAKLVKRFADRPGVRVRQAALGQAPDTLVLNVLASRTCSSLLDPSGIREKHAGKPLDVVRRIPAPVVRLDRDMDRPPQAVKLDLQGYELAALRGAEAFLHAVDVLLVEVAFRPLYADQPLADEVRGWLEDRGFVLDGLYAPWRDGRGDLVSGDALFVRSGKNGL